MANLNETAGWDDVKQLEIVDRVVGGAGGKANEQAQQLVNRTAFLKGKIDDIADAGAGKGAEMVGFLPAGIGAVARSMQEKARDRVSVKDFGAAFDFNGTTGTDDSAAWSAAIAWAKANYPATLHVNDGISLCASVWPVLDVPVSIVGDGRAYVCFPASVTGQCVTVRNTGFGNESNFMPVGGDAAFSNSDFIMAGTELRGFWILGNRAAAAKQHGLVFEGNCDFSRIDLDIGYFSGSGFWVGKSYGGIRGNFREPSLLRIRTRSCGNADGTASILFEVADSGEADSINLCKNIDMECVFPYGRGIEFKDARSVANGAGMYGLSGRLMVHGTYPTAYTNNGALLHFEGDVQLMDFEVNIGYNRGATEDIVFARNAVTGLFPRDIKLRTRHPNSVRAYKVEYGANIQIDILYAFTQKEILTIGSAFSGPLTIDNQSDAQFIAYPTSIQLNGTTPIALTSWNGGVLGFPGITTFMPVVNANGAGDTTKCAIFGVKGTIARTGDSTTGTDAYTFTPDSASSVFIPAGTYFSKFVIGDTDMSRVSGRYVQSPAHRAGMSTSGFWASKRLLKIDPWHMWIQNSNGVPRINYGEPTSDTAGRALSLWNKGYVGGSATPSVAGLNFLVANYGSATTATNFTGGIDGQVLHVVATNANCTIQNNANILTKTAANIVMTTNQCVQFVYLSDLSKWVQVQ